MKPSRSTPRPVSRSPGEPTPKYSTFPLPELFKLWERGDLTETQMIGHLLQHVDNLDSRVRHLEYPPKSEPTAPMPDAAG